MQAIIADDPEGGLFVLEDIHWTRWKVMRWQGSLDDVESIGR